MRLHLRWHFPIALMALLVQLLTPIGLIQQAAAFATDPLQLGAICSEHANLADQHPTPAGAPQTERSCCIFCFGAGSAPILPDASRIFVTVQVEHQRIVWLADRTARRTAAVASNAQARAPPAFS